jgi:hypothetical protein
MPKQKNLSPELKAILLAGSAFSDRSCLPQLQAALQEPLDWQRFLKLVRHQCLGGLMYRVLGRLAGPARVPDYLIKQLRTDYLATYVLGVRRQQTFFILHDNCRCSGIEIMPLKGFALAQSAYGDLGVRSAGVDLDMLVRESDKETVIRKLKDLGFVAADGEQDHVVTFIKGNQFIDLHWSLLPLGLRSVPVENLWERSLKIIVDGNELSVISPEDMVVFLALQGRHDWPHLSLTRLVDIHTIIIKSGSSFNWSYLKDVGRSARLTSTLSFSLGLCQELLQTPLAIGRTIKSKIFLSLLGGRLESLIIPGLMPRTSAGFLKMLKPLLVDGYPGYFLFQIKRQLFRRGSRINKAACASENHQKNSY